MTCALCLLWAHSQALQYLVTGLVHQLASYWMQGALVIDLDAVQVVGAGTTSTHHYETTADLKMSQDSGISEGVTLKGSQREHLLFYKAWEIYTYYCISGVLD